MSRVSLYMSVLLCAALLVLSGCGKSKGASEPASEAAPPATDALWAWAPPDTSVGFVMADGAGARVLAAVRALEAAAEQRPTLSMYRAGVYMAANSELGFDVLDPAAYAERGISLERGAAVFFRPDGWIAAVLPVGDRAAFAAAWGGVREGDDDVFEDLDLRCRELGDRYACSTEAEVLARMGSSRDMVGRMAEYARGEFEAWVSDEVWRDTALSELFADSVTGHLAVQLEPGGFTARGHFSGRWKQPSFRAFAKSSQVLAEQVAAQRPPSFFRVSVPVFRELVPESEAEQVMANLPKLDGFDLQHDFLDNLTGEIVSYAPEGRGAFEVVVGAHEGGRLQPLVEKLCEGFEIGLDAPGMRTWFEGGRCVMEIAIGESGEVGATAANMIAFDRVRAELGTEPRGVVLRLSTLGGGDRAPRPRVEQAPLARELAEQPWNLALWGEGSVLGVWDAEHLSSRDLDALDEFTPEMRDGLWLLAHLSSLGGAAAFRDDGIHALLHVGTQFANPVSVLERFQTLAGQVVDGDAAALAALADLARKHPGTPLGRAHALGARGLVSLLVPTGILAAVAVPAFVRYQERSREALEQLEQHSNEGFDEYE